MTTPTMAEQLVPDEVWAAIEPLLPAKPPHPKGGRPWIEDRAVLGGIIYVLRAGVPWRLLPARELGCGSGVTCWRRLRDWQAAGVWEALHHRLLDWLGDDGQVDWSRAAIDSVSVRARRGGVDWRESGRPRQAGIQVPPADRRHRDPAGGRVVGGQPMTRCCWNRSWMRSRRSSGRGAGPAGRASGQPSCTPTKACATRRCVTGWGEGTHRWAVAAARLKLRAARPG